jgi:hypothetical protein
MRNVRHFLVALAMGLVLAPVAFADPPADKGKGANAAQAKGGGKPQADTSYEDPKGKYDDKGRYDDKGKHYDDKDGNHGQVVSECNHRANQKNLKGKDRKEYVDWCTDNGAHAKYDDRRYDSERSCYRRADEKGLSGDTRRKFLNECLEKQRNSTRETHVEPRGRDVLGKGTN